MTEITIVVEELSEADDVRAEPGLASTCCCCSRERVVRSRTR